VKAIKVTAVEGTSRRRTMEWRTLPTDEELPTTD
jgi:hypothetical protein